MQKAVLQSIGLAGWLLHCLATNGLFFLGAEVLLVERAVAQLAAIERAVAAAEAQGVRTGVAVCDDTGHVLYRHRAAEAFAPASNMKLLTAAAVLSGLGADYRFRTAFRLEAGMLVVEASGDPNWITGTDHAPERIFADVARELRSRDVTRLNDIELRAGTFVGPDRPPTWPQDQLFTYYCAPTGPFVLEQGVFRMRIEATGSGDARVTLLAPPAGYEVRGSIPVVRSQRGAVYGAIDEGDAVRVRGKFFHRSPPVEIRTSVNNSARWFRDTLVHQLARGGVRVDANFDAGGDFLVHEHRSEIGPAILRLLEDSSNFDAEQLLRVLGAETRRDGSLQGGLEAMRGEIEKLVGALPANVVLLDGSGLSADNRLTPGVLVVALYRGGDGPNAALQHACLPVAGRTGTLEGRFLDSDLVGRVRAKTGWIRGASSLSGLVECENGETRWFSILMNYDRSRNGLNKDLKLLQEQIVTAVAAMVPAR